MVFRRIIVAIISAQTIVWADDWCHVGGVVDPEKEMDSIGWCVGSQYGSVFAGLVV